LEVLLRITGIVPHSYPAPGLFAPDPGVGYRMVSHYTGMYLKSGRWFSVNTNAQGFRDRADFTAPSSAQRVLAIGDSFVFGMPVEPDDAIVARIERELNEYAGVREWQLLNAGVPGYGTRQELVVLRRLLPLTAPAAV